MDTDLSLTQEILKVIAIFVTNLNRPKLPENCEKNSSKRGRMTKMVKALKLSNELEKKALADEDIETKECPKDGYHKAENDSNNEDHASMDEMNEPETEIPENIKFLRETIQHCRHFISMIGRPHWQLLSMEIVGESMLQVQMQENELLPLVHLVWQPLKLLFSSNNLFVVEKAFHVLRIMAQCAKNFIRRRTLDDIFPDLVTYIKKLQIMVNDRGLQQTMAARYSIVKDSTVILVVNSKIVQIRPTVKAVSTKISKKAKTALR